MRPVIDTAYEMLQDLGPEYGPMEFSNHGPMAAEAMVALGREDAVLPWLERYARQLGAMPESTAPVTDEAAAAALGDIRRYRDWVEFFDARLAAQPWPTVVDAWAAALAPGMIGAALHGILRAAHATRALAQAPNAVRRHELAQGLAYWAACYHALPADPSPRTAGRRPGTALRLVPFLPSDERCLGGSIADALRPLSSFTPFRAVAGLVDTDAADPGELLSDLTLAFAGSYLANANRTTLIAFIHFVTGPSAIRLLLPHVSDTTARRLLAYAWQAGAALHCVYGRTTEVPPRPDAAIARDALVDRAIASGDEHAVKFVEACLREDAVRPDPLFRAAARDAIDRLSAAW